MNLLLHMTVLEARERSYGMPQSALLGTTQPAALRTHGAPVGCGFSAGPAPAPALCSCHRKPPKSSCLWGSPPVLPGPHTTASPLKVTKDPQGATSDINPHLRSHIARWVSSVRDS